MKRNIQGYTLYELLVVLIIIAIMLTSAVPLLTSNFARQSNQVVTNQLQALINYAQEQALRKDANLQICGATYNTNSNGNSTYLNNCAATNSWSGGALVYQDLNANGSYNSGERVLSYRFDYGAAVCASKTNYPDPTSCVNGSFAESSVILTVNTDGTLSDASNDSKWYFTIANTEFASTRYSQFSLNSYGFFCTYRDFDGNVSTGC